MSCETGARNHVTRSDHIIEVISPGGFEDYFREVAEAWGDLEAFARINDRDHLEMDFRERPRPL
jgi:hypothetical protein